MVVLWVFFGISFWPSGLRGSFGPFWEFFWPSGLPGEFFAEFFGEFFSLGGFFSELGGVLCGVLFRFGPGVLWEFFSSSLKYPGIPSLCEVRRS